MCSCTVHVSEEERNRDEGVIDVNLACCLCRAPAENLLRGSIATEQDSRIVSWNELNKSIGDHTRASVKFEDERADADDAALDDDEVLSLTGWKWRIIAHRLNVLLLACVLSTLVRM